LLLGRNPSRLELPCQADCIISAYFGPCSPHPLSTLSPSRTKPLMAPDRASVPSTTMHQCPHLTNPAPCHLTPPHVPITSLRPIAHQMETKLKREGNEIDFDLNLVNGSQNQRLETKTLMAHVFGSQSTSSSAWSTNKMALINPGHLFSSAAKHHRHHTILLHPNIARLVAKEEETPPPPSKEELKLEVHQKDPTTSPMFLVSASSSPSYTRPHQ
jgi:hypothetical protein